MSMPEHIAPEELEPGDHLEPGERDIEAPTADAMEQATPADPSQREVHPSDLHRGLEVNEYDALEQARVVELDDDYRP